MPLSEKSPLLAGLFYSFAEGLFCIKAKEHHSQVILQNDLSCDVMQHVAACCSMLQHVAACCSML